jgi:DNA-binding NarL/FixJ family response regulator
MNHPIRVLLVDDHQTILWGVQQLIKNEAGRIEVVETATSAVEALAKLDASKPDVVLLDLDLGVGNIPDLIPQLKERSHAQVLILTGVRNQAVLDAAILNGARGIVRKEEPAERIIQAIHTVVSGQFWLDREATRRLFEAFMERDAHKAKIEQRLARLTVKEQQVVQAFVEDSTASNKALAKKLFLSEHTLRHHLTSIYNKLGVNNRLALYLYLTSDCKEASFYDGVGGIDKQPKFPG